MKGIKSPTIQNLHQSPSILLEKGVIEQLLFHRSSLCRAGFFCVPFQPSFGSFDLLVSLSFWYTSIFLEHMKEQTGYMKQQTEHMKEQTGYMKQQTSMNEQHERLLTSINKHLEKLSASNLQVGVLLTFECALFLSFEMRTGIQYLFPSLGCLI